MLTGFAARAAEERVKAEGHGRGAAVVERQRMTVMRRWMMAALPVVGCALLVALSMAGCGRGPAAGGGPSGGRGMIEEIGSTTVLPLAEKWREGYNREHPEVQIAVSGGGSGTGIRALISGTAAIANSSRDISAEEMEQAKAAGVEPMEHVVAYDGIAVIVHPSNPIEAISLEELSKVFSGQVGDWDGLGVGGLRPIQVVSRDSASGTYEAFKELVITMGGKEQSRDYAASALKQTSNQGILALVAQTKSAIGYVGLGYLGESVKTVPVVPAGGGPAVAPTVESVTAGTYPISRALYCYTNGEPTGELKGYMDWIKGPEGQRIVEELGFVPVKGG
jgi:phosphate transport system substrate-binding protein